MTEQIIRFQTSRCKNLVTITADLATGETREVVCGPAGYTHCPECLAEMAERDRRFKEDWKVIRNMQPFDYDDGSVRDEGRRLIPLNENRIDERD